MKELKNLASDAKNLPPAIINPIISLLTFFKFYILVTCLSTPRPRHSFSLSRLNSTNKFPFEIVLRHINV